MDLSDGTSVHLSNIYTHNKCTIFVWKTPNIETEAVEVSLPEKRFTLAPIYRFSVRMYIILCMCGFRLD